MNRSLSSEMHVKQGQHNPISLHNNNQTMESFLHMQSLHPVTIQVLHKADIRIDKTIHVKILYCDIYLNAFLGLIST